MLSSNTLSQMLLSLKRSAQTSCSRSRICSYASRKETEAIRNGDPKVRWQERILITGISCRMPSSRTMEEFQANLLAGVEMVTRASQWNRQPRPPKLGFVTDYDKFDAEFFGIDPEQARLMDSQYRKLLEVAFEAVIDAGLHPADLSGSRTGVFVGMLRDEFSREAILSVGSKNHRTTLHANSFCDTSLMALEEAVSAIREDTYDAAIVASSSRILSPEFTEAFVDINAYGTCKSFDESAATDFARSEAVVAILIQKESAAKRHYATIRHIESTEDAHKDKGMASLGQRQEALLRTAYKKSGIDPASVTYIETNGAADTREVEAIYNVFCRDIQNRPPLVLGCVKTNIGHTQSAAGLCGVAKIIACIQSGVIPANLYLREGDPAVKHRFSHAIEVASEPRECKRGVFAINDFGPGSTNSHLILEPGPSKSRPRQMALHAADISVIVPFSGRTKQAVHNSIGRAAELGVKHPAVFSLLQNVFRQSIPGHSHRGFGIMSFKGSAKVKVIEEATIDNMTKRPLWYVFPGIGSQWPSMGKDLMKFEVFAESMTQSAKTLKNADIDLLEILGFADVNLGGSLYVNIRHGLVATAAVQIALYDLLASIGLRPDGYLGHSGGETLCAYADGCLSHEQTLLVTDALGRAILDGVREEGSMASVELTPEEAKARCPPGTYVSCHNGRANVSITGRPKDVENLVQLLIDEDVFAQEVDCCGVAVHNRHFTGDAPELMEKYMKEIYPEPRLRSSKWISTSVPEKDWRRNPVSQYCSAAYFANNLIQPVLFYEATKHIPSSAVVVEVAPAGHFQGFLKDTLPTCHHIAPMSSSANDKILFFLRKIGKLHNVGLDVNLGQLYPRATYPVPAKVPYLSPLVNWKHNETWNTIDNLTSPRDVCNPDDSNSGHESNSTNAKND